MRQPDPPPAAADRNLLFGVLALQMDFVGRDALIAAMNAWVLDKSKPLGQVLLGQGALRPDTHALLDALVQKHLELHGDAGRSLAAVSSLGSVRDDLRQIADADLQASLANVPAGRPADGDPFSTRLPSTVGTPTSAGLRFRTLRPHARGGLGEVFVAYDEELHREVALKEIQDRHADSPESRTRFVLEAEITGGLEHPGVVPVYGLGHYADGRPFYAMRFVRGDSLQGAIARYHRAESAAHDRGRRAVEFRELLGRFIDVCNAVAYAHSRGVLHRDLKPGNVMLGKYGETLVVDWGLAKTQGRPEGEGGAEESPLRPASASGTPETLPGSAVGTPQFMSPEQAAGRLDQLGPASDVYSLGATLYCLLTGRPPFPDPREAGLGEVLQRVQRGEFPPPRQVAREAPAALSAVCLKAMALKPGDRYGSPRALADDVDRWLADEAVAAWRGPWWVRLARWGRRHRPLVTGAAVLLLTAVAALSTSLVLLGRKQAEVVREGDAARKAKDQAEAINRFLVEDLLAAARPEELGKDVPMRKVLDKAAEKVETAFPDQPEVEAAVRLAIGDSYQRLGLHPEAEKHLRCAAGLRGEHLGAEHPDTLKAVDSLAMLLEYAGKYDEAVPLFRDTLEARRRVLGPEHRDTLWSLHNWAWSLHNRGKWAQAEPLYRECLEARRRVVGPDKRETLMTAHNLAQVVYYQGRLDEAEKLHRENLEARRRALGPEHPHTLYSMNDLAMALHDRKKLDEAEALYRQTLEVERRVVGPEHRETLTVICNLAKVLRDAEKLEEAERLFRHTLEVRGRVLGPEHPDTLMSMSELALTLEDRGKPKEAEALKRKVLALRQQTLGPDHPDTITAKDNLANFVMDQGKAAEAEALFREVLEGYRRVLGPEHPDTSTAMAMLGRALSANGKREEAEQLLRQRAEMNKRVHGPEHADTLLAVNNLAQMLQSHDKLEEAEALFRQVLEARRRTLGPENHATLVSMSDLAVTLTGRQKWKEAEDLYRQAYEVRRRVSGPANREALTLLGNLTWLLKDQRRFDEAERLQREEVDIRTRAQGAEHPDTLLARYYLALLLRDEGKLDAAERLNREVLEAQRRALAPEHADTLNTMSALAAVLADREAPDKAVPLFREVLRARRKHLPAGHKNLASPLSGLGAALTAMGKAREAEPLLRESLAIQRKAWPNDWTTANVESVLGGCLTALGRYAEAESLLVGAYDKMRAAPLAMPSRVRRALGRVVKLYEAWNKPGEAATWRAKQKEAEKPAQRPSPR